jgi:hypothetical protein
MSKSDDTAEVAVKRCIKNIKLRIHKLRACLVANIEKADSIFFFANEDRKL